jgi:hypothetical protein
VSVHSAGKKAQRPVRAGSLLFAASSGRNLNRLLTYDEPAEPRIVLESNVVSQTMNAALTA